MFFKQIVHEDLGCASYVLCSNETGECAVVDPRWEIEPYLEVADKHGFRISLIIETHNHADHVSGHGRLAVATGATIAVHEDAEVEYPHRALRNDEVIALGDVNLRVIHTPGHRPEHIALAVQDTSRGDEPWMVLTGDSLLVGDVARPDLAIDGQEGASALYGSLHDKLLRLPEYAAIYPAHVSGSLCGRVTSTVNSTTLGYERHFNQALSLKSLDEFVSYMNENLPVRPPNMENIVQQNRGPLMTENPPVPALDPAAARRAVKDGAVLLDVRSSQTYLTRHIPQSVHVSLSSAQFGTRVGFVLSPETRIVLVADSPAEASWAIDSLRVVALNDLAGWIDMAAWQSAGEATTGTKHMAPEQLQMLGNGADAPRILDVREPNEWNAGHIPGATFIPYRELPRRASEVPCDGSLAVICGSGSRSPVAISLLEGAGWTNLIDVDGGMAGWERAGLPTVQDEQPAVDEHAKVRTTVG